MRPACELAYAIQDDPDIEVARKKAVAEKKPEKDCACAEEVERTCVKLQSSEYLKKKSTRHVLKKILQTIEGAFQSGLESLVIALGRTIGKIICALNPLPEYSLVRLGGRNVKYLNQEEFVNYGETVKTTPGVTYFPKSVGRYPGDCQAGQLKVKEGALCWHAPLMDPNLC